MYNEAGKTRDRTGGSFRLLKDSTTFENMKNRYMLPMEPSKAESGGGSPDTLTFESFQERLKGGKEDLCRVVYEERKDSIQIKKEKTVVKNLRKIFDATFRICARKGFQGMSMRDLCQESGLSMGALYSYFKSKEELLNTLQRVGNTYIQGILAGACSPDADARTKLRLTIKTHLYLSEIVQPWFYFSYMEAKSMNEQERAFYKQAELYTESIIYRILKQGADEGLFRQQDHQLASGVIKAMLQDWYLKRWKYAKRNVNVDQYAEFILAFIEAFYLLSDQEPAEHG